MIARDQQLTDLYLRCRLGEQKQFYRGRAKEFQKARNQSRITVASLLFLASVGGALSGADVAGGRRWWALAAGVLSALAAALTSYEAVYGFDRLSREYERTIAALARLEARFPAEPYDHPSDTDTATLIHQAESVLTGEVDRWAKQTTSPTVDVPRPDSDTDQQPIGNTPLT